MSLVWFCEWETMKPMSINFSHTGKKFNAKISVNRHERYLYLGMKKIKNIISKISNYDSFNKTAATHGSMESYCMQSQQILNIEIHWPFCAIQTLSVIIYTKDGRDLWLKQSYSACWIPSVCNIFQWLHHSYSLQNTNAVFRFKLYLRPSQ